MLVKDIAVRASAYGILGAVVDGMNVLDVFEAAGKAVSRARGGEGPALIECKTYRYRGHSRFESPGYRTQEELGEWLEKDPIQRFSEHLRTSLGVHEDELRVVENEVDLEIDEAVRFAESSPDPSPRDYAQYIFA